MYFLPQPTKLLKSFHSTNFVRSIYEALKIQSSSQLSSSTDLDLLFTSCLNTFKSDPRYRDDIRFLKIWFLHVMLIPFP